MSRPISSSGKELTGCSIATVALSQLRERLPSLGVTENYELALESGNADCVIIENDLGMHPE